MMRSPGTQDLALDKQPQVLVVEDDASMRAILDFNLREEGFAVESVERGDLALARLPAGVAAQGLLPPFDLVLTDVKMPGADGLAVLSAAKACHPDIQVVLVTAFGSVDAAVDAIARGAADYITKPFRRDELKARVRHAMACADLARENRLLRSRVEEARGPRILTRSKRFLELLRIVDRLAALDVTVLVTGESGTGKDLVARRLHARSARTGPYVPLNCAALPAQLLESELFGHERGAFTGADRRRLGRFEQADRGTLFLDEIGELPLELQAKILRAIEEGVVERLGGQERVAVDVRLVAATHRDLAADVAAGRFREDLYHRLSVVPLHLPPLRERPEDIELLVHAFLEELCGEPLTVAPALIEVLEGRAWPGNVRELRNLLSRMAILRRGPVLDLADLALPGGGSPPQPVALPSPNPTNPLVGRVAAPLTPGEIDLPEDGFSLPGVMREIVLKALERHGGNRSATARYLGIPRHVLLYRLARYEHGEDLDDSP